MSLNGFHHTFFIKSFFQRSQSFVYRIARSYFYTCHEPNVLGLANYECREILLGIVIFFQVDVVFSGVGFLQYIKNKIFIKIEGG